MPSSYAAWKCGGGHAEAAALLLDAAADEHEVRGFECGVMIRRVRALRANIRLMTGAARSAGIR